LKGIKDRAIGKSPLGFSKAQDSSWPRNAHTLAAASAIAGSSKHL
jgi:hypothetical protein